MLPLKLGVHEVLPIPVFNNDKVIPPFIGDNAGSTGDQQSPYKAELEEVVDILGFSERRLEILLQFIEYRRALRAVGLVRGRHWINGSFVENKEPNDIDVVTLIKSSDVSYDPELAATAVIPFTNREEMRQLYNLDAIIVDMDGSTEIMLDRIGFYLILFSHRRDDFIWKGILSVELGSDDNDASVETKIRNRLAVGRGQ